MSNVLRPVYRNITTGSLIEAKGDDIIERPEKDKMYFEESTVIKLR